MGYVVAGETCKIRLLQHERRRSPTKPMNYRRLYLDDVRVPKDDTWIVVKRAPEALKLLLAGDIDECSLDHDLGYKIKPVIDGKICKDQYDHSEPTGTDLVKWMIALDAFPKSKITIHSFNPPAGKWMFDTLSAHIQRHNLPISIEYRPSATP